MFPVRQEVLVFQFPRATNRRRWWCLYSRCWPRRPTSRSPVQAYFGSWRLQSSARSGRWRLDDGRGSGDRRRVIVVVSSGARLQQAGSRLLWLARIQNSAVDVTTQNGWRRSGERAWHRRLSRGLVCLLGTATVSRYTPVRSDKTWRRFMLFCLLQWLSLLVRCRTLPPATSSRR